MEKPVEGRSIRDRAVMGRIQCSIILRGKPWFALWTFLESTPCFLREYGAWKCFPTVLGVFLSFVDSQDLSAFFNFSIPDYGYELDSRMSGQCPVEFLGVLGAIEHRNI